MMSSRTNFVTLFALGARVASSDLAPTPVSNTTVDFPSSCDDKSGGDWPEFPDQSSLSMDTKWSKYFELVYGEIPSFGYPICVSGFHVIYPTALATAGIDKKPMEQASQLGDYYQGKEFRNSMNLIYHGKGPFAGFRSNQWVEALHCGAEKETDGAWYYYGPGSGIWINSGSTKIYQRRQESWKEILGMDDCGHDFQCGGQLFKTAKDKFGWDTVQYVAESGGGPRTTGGGDKFMFIQTTGQGKYTCGAKQSLWKAGWVGQSDCDCDQSKKCQNCKGYSSADQCDDCQPAPAPAHGRRRRGNNSHNNGHEGHKGHSRRRSSSEVDLEMSVTVVV